MGKLQRRVYIRLHSLVPWRLSTHFLEGGGKGTTGNEGADC